MVDTDDEWLMVVVDTSVSHPEDNSERLMKRAAAYYLKSFRGYGLGYMTNISCVGMNHSITEGTVCSGTML